MKPSKRARRRARGRAIASRPPYSAAAMAWGHWRTVDIARAGGFQAYQRKWAFLFADEADCFDCGLSQEDAREELQRIERSLCGPLTVRPGGCQGVLHGLQYGHRGQRAPTATRQP